MVCRARLAVSLFLRPVAAAHARGCRRLPAAQEPTGRTLPPPFLLNGRPFERRKRKPFLRETYPDCSHSRRRPRSPYMLCADTAPTANLVRTAATSEAPTARRHHNLLLLGRVPFAQQVRGDGGWSINVGGWWVGGGVGIDGTRACHLLSLWSVAFMSKKSPGPRDLDIWLGPPQPSIAQPKARRQPGRGLLILDVPISACENGHQQPNATVMRPLAGCAGGCWRLWRGADGW